MPSVHQWCWKKLSLRHWCHCSCCLWCQWQNTAQGRRRGPWICNKKPRALEQWALSVPPLYVHAAVSRSSFLIWYWLQYLQGAHTARRSCLRQRVWCPAVALLWRSQPKQLPFGEASHDWTQSSPYLCRPLDPGFWFGQINHRGCIYLTAEWNYLITSPQFYQILIMERLPAGLDEDKGLKYPEVRSPCCSTSGRILSSQLPSSQFLQVGVVGPAANQQIIFAPFHFRVRWEVRHIFRSSVHLCGCRLSKQEKFYKQAAEHTRQVLQRLVWSDQRGVRSSSPQLHPVAVAVEVLSRHKQEQDWIISYLLCYADNKVDLPGECDKWSLESSSL